MANTFPYQGRSMVSTPGTDGNTSYAYRSTQTESDRIFAKYGPGYVLLDPIKPNQGIVLLGEYKKGETNPRAYAPAKDTVPLNGITNEQLFAATYSDPTFKQLVTKAPPSGAATIDPNSQNQTPSGATEELKNTYRYEAGNPSRKTLLIYPINMHQDQDHIRIKIFKLNKNPEENVKNLASKFESVRSKQAFGSKGDEGQYVAVEDQPTIILPIQAPIIDQNLANWGAGELNELQRILVKASATTMTSGGKNGGDYAGAFNKGLDSIIASVKGQEAGLRNLLTLGLLEQAVNVPGLLSRATGSVLNPNMELLFQGPQLRPFNFTFKMSPREKAEADNVKAIIKTFKKNMAPKIGKGIFLQAPNVFKIEYVNGKTNETHDSINLIKVCALQNFSVDYTPNNTYMTFDDNQDPEASMVGYNMTLTFSEITPIYDRDYEEKHPIGF